MSLPSLASGLTFLCQLTEVVLENRLNRYLSLFVFVVETFCTIIVHLTCCVTKLCNVCSQNM